MKISFHYRIVCIFFKLLFKICYRGEIYGLENIPENGGVIFASNHVSHLDPPLIAVHSKRQPVYSLARSTLFNKWNRWFYNRLYMVGINREKGSDIHAIKEILQLLKNGNAISMFPEGTRSTTGIPQRGKKGIGLFVSRSQVPVIPVRIFGTFEAFPKGARFLNFKPHLTIVYGKPLYPQTFDTCMNTPDPIQAISDRIMQEICNIQIPEK